MSARDNVSLFFFLKRRQPPTSTLFPYTPLFRSRQGVQRRGADQRPRRGGDQRRDEVEVPARDLEAGERQHELGRDRREDVLRLGENTAELHSPHNILCPLFL